MAMSIPVTAPIAAKVDAARAAVSRVVARAGRVSRIARARIGYGAGVVSAAWGVGVLFGFGWFLIVGGVTAAWSFLHLYPVDES